MTPPLGQRWSFACAAALGMLGASACSDATEPPSQPAGEQGSQDSNDMTAAETDPVAVDGSIVDPNLDPTATQILFVADQSPDGDKEESYAGTVGQKLYTQLFSVGATSSWTVSMAGVSSIKTTTECHPPGKVVSGTCTRIDLIDTNGLAPGTYELLASFSGEVDGAMRTATITVHITLSAR